MLTVHVVVSRCSHISLQSADSVRDQLARILERVKVPIVSSDITSRECVPRMRSTCARFLLVTYTEVFV